MRVGSLFSGIGGIELGFEREGFETVFFVENDLYAQTILRKRFKSIPIYDDITKINWKKMPRVDILTGGFPCQDASRANSKGKGIEGKRTGLWSYFREAIRLLRPRYVIIENVPNLLKRGFSRVLCDLAKIGYDAEWRTLRACDFGAPHVRERLFVIAYPMRNAAQGSRNKKKSKEQLRHTEIPYKDLDAWQDELSEPVLLGNGNGLSFRMDRTRCLGNAVIPQVAQYVARHIKRRESLR